MAAAKKATKRAKPEKERDDVSTDPRAGVRRADGRKGSDDPAAGVHRATGETPADGAELENDEDGGDAEEEE